MKIIEITINFAGRTTIETKGFSGNDCSNATRSLEKALGLVQLDERKPEYFNQQVVECQASSQPLSP